MRARIDMDDVGTGLTLDLRIITQALGQIEDGSELDDAIARLSTFCAVALRVMRKTNPSKVRDEARTVEIKARMDGKDVVIGERRISA